MLYIESQSCILYDNTLAASWLHFNYTLTDQVLIQRYFTGTLYRE